MTKAKFFLRDLFKPRYALIVEIEHMPKVHQIEEWKDSFTLTSIPVPVIMKVPYKRPFFMPYNVFVNGMKAKFGLQALILFGSKSTLMNLDGIGSVLPHNMNRAVTFTEAMVNETR